MSAITCWETGVLVSRERIHLNAPCLAWVEQALTAPGVSLLELTPRIAIEASFLPGGFHGGPADRLLCASARVHGVTLATRDRNILAYAKKGYVRAMVC